MKHLIVNADDYGRTDAVSRGIREAHLRGIVNSTSAMMNLPGADDAVREAVAECPRLGLGVHLTLTAGAPRRRASEVPSLIGGDGQFLNQREFARHAAEINPHELEGEWRAQIETFVETAARAPDHLDSHHHTSYLTPILFAIMLDLAHEYGCPVRLPRATEADDPRLRFTVKMLAESGVPHPDFLRVEFYGDGATRANLFAILQSLRDGVTELMTHPGYNDAELMRGSSYNAQRERELQILTNAEVKQMLALQQIAQKNFGALKGQN